MDYRFWWVGIGLAAVFAMRGLHRAGRKAANARLAQKGVLAQAEIVRCELHAERFAWTEVTFRYLPEGKPVPVTVTRQLDGHVRLAVGDRVPIRYLPSQPSVSMLVGQEEHHDAS